MRDSQEDKRGNSNLLTWIIGIGAAIVAAALIFFVLSTIVLEKLTPEELAQRWVQSNVDATGEEIAAFVSGNNWAVRELGGEWLESKINDVVHWRYGPTQDVGGGITEVVTTASVSFDVQIPAASGNVRASLPFLLAVDREAQQVTSWRVDVTGAAFSATIPALEERIDEAKQAVEGKVEAVKNMAGSIGKMVEDGNCLEAARDAGVPDNVIELLDRPASERGMMERTLVTKAIEAAGLSEQCRDLVE